MSVTYYDKQISFSRWLEAALKIQILNDNETILDELVSFHDMGSITTDSSSYVRRTFSFTVHPTNQDRNIGEHSKIWINKQAKVLLGLKTPRMSDFEWYDCGDFVFTDTASTYNQEDNSITIHCSDRMIQLDGTANGELGALKTIIPAYETEFSSIWIEASKKTDWDEIWSYTLTQYKPMYEHFSPGNQSDLKTYFQDLLTDYSSEKSDLLVPKIQAIYDLENSNTVIQVTHTEKSNITTITANYKIRDTLISIITQQGNVQKYMIDDIGQYYGTIRNNNYHDYRQSNPLWDCIPYDLEYSAGANVGDMITNLIELYPNYDAAFDESGIFHVQMIPSCNEDDILLTNDEIQSVFISESCSTPLSAVRNVVHVWGQVFDTEWYSETVTDSNSIYSAAIETYDEYKANDLVAIKIPVPNGSNQQIKVNSLNPYPIYDYDTDQPLAANRLAPGVYTFKYIRERFYLQGQWQAHALSVLVNDFEPDWYADTVSMNDSVYSVTLNNYSGYKANDRIAIKIPASNKLISSIKINSLDAVPIHSGETGSRIQGNALTPDTYLFKYENNKFYLLGQAYIEAYTCSDKTVTAKYSKKYFQDKYSVETVNMEKIPNSPFSVQKIGERLSTKSGSVYDNITSDSLALLRADDDLRKLSRLTDNITIEAAALMPWLKEYQKISYQKKNETEIKQFITDTVTLNLSEGTTTITMHTFYPLYEN